MEPDHTSRVRLEIHLKTGRTIEIEAADYKLFQNDKGVITGYEFDFAKDARSRLVALDIEGIAAIIEHRNIGGVGFGRDRDSHGCAWYPQCPKYAVGLAENGKWYCAEHAAIIERQIKELEALQ